MYRTILLAFDASSHALASVVHARELATGGSTTVHILHVAQPGADREPVERSMHHARLQLQGAGVAEVETAIVEAEEPGPAIVEQTERLGCQAVLMGTRGQTEGGENLLGSVAEYVLRHSRAAAVILAGPAASSALVLSGIKETDA